MVGLYGIYVVVMACNKPLETLFSKCFCCQDSDDINDEDASYPDKSLVLTYHRSYGDPSAGLSVIGTKDDMPNGNVLLLSTFFLPLVVCASSFPAIYAPLIYN